MKIEQIIMIIKDYVIPILQILFYIVTPIIAFNAFRYAKKSFNRNFKVNETEFIRKLVEDIEEAEKEYTKRRKDPISKEEIINMDRRFINKVETFSYFAKKLNLSKEDIKFLSNVLLIAKKLSDELNQEKENFAFNENINYIIDKYNINLKS